MQQLALRAHSGGISGKRMADIRAGLAQLAFVLASRADRPIVDMTDLKGVYDFKLQWTPDDPESGPDRGILGALSQLGLHLDSRKMPAQILVIDHVNRKPTPN